VATSFSSTEFGAAVDLLTPSHRPALAEQLVETISNARISPKVVHRQSDEGCTMSCDV